MFTIGDWGFGFGGNEWGLLGETWRGGELTTPVVDLRAS